MSQLNHTFKCDDCMVITIPLGSQKEAQDGQLMPESFQCVFKDAYKVFLYRGKPRSLGAAQAAAGVFICGLSVLQEFPNYGLLFYALSSILFLISGALSYASACSPNICMAKLSFFLNTFSVFWSVAAIPLSLHYFTFSKVDVKVANGIRSLIVALLVGEMAISSVLIYWQSKAVCRQQYNTLPVVILRQENKMEPDKPPVPQRLKRV
ncbi:uncharacterized protein LOC130118577 [Lampris incognitus]|uniref:uncharacterized protein LOC130118577 n=1 Tax=Lampris incognitus TaxID=2546036 RepID=UPI0024B4E0FD|nr:uncharacterized protein LOC130118577 [Lampris incognitus]